MEVFVLCEILTSLARILYMYLISMAVRRWSWPAMWLLRAAYSPEHGRTTTTAKVLFPYRTYHYEEQPTTAPS